MALLMRALYADFSYLGENLITKEIQDSIFIKGLNGLIFEFFSGKLIASILTSETGIVHLGLAASTRYQNYYLFCHLACFNKFLGQI